MDCSNASNQCRNYFGGNLARNATLLGLDALQSLGASYLDSDCSCSSNRRWLADS